MLVHIGGRVYIGFRCRPFGSEIGLFHCYRADMMVERVPCLKYARQVTFDVIQLSEIIQRR